MVTVRKKESILQRVLRRNSCIDAGETVQMVLLSGKALSKKTNSLDGVMWLAIYSLYLINQAGCQLCNKFLERKFKSLSF